MCTDVAQALYGARTQSPNPPSQSCAAAKTPPRERLRARPVDRSRPPAPRRLAVRPGAGVAPAQPLPRPPAASGARRTVCSITRHWILLRETRGGVTGEPPLDVLAGGNVTLPRSFIALRWEAITTMFFPSFFLVSPLLLILFYMN